MERDPRTYKMPEKDPHVELPPLPDPYEHHDHLKMRELREKDPPESALPKGFVERDSLEGPDSTGHYPPQVDEETLDCAPGGFQYVPVEREDPLPGISLILSSLNIHMEVNIPFSELSTLTLQFKIK